MPEYIRALIVILGLSTAIFYVVKPRVVQFGITVEDFVRRRNAWYLITLAGFLAQNYWVFVVLVVIIVRYAANRDTNKIALFLFLCLALPQIRVDLPGFAGINYFFDVDYLRILTLLVLLPICIIERKKANNLPSSIRAIDGILAVYITYCFIPTLIHDSVTGIIRAVLAWTIDVIIPYYAFSRYLKDTPKFFAAFGSFVIGAMIASLIGVFEIMRSWILYASAGAALNVDWSAGYLLRGESIRAMATSGQAIVFGYVTAIALGCYAFVKGNEKITKTNLLFAGILIAGQISSLSKGPWLGTLFMGLVLLATGKNVTKKIIVIIFTGVPLAIILSATDFGQKLISYLPFVGTLDEGSVEYRQKVFEESMKVILENPWFGSLDFRSKLESLRQGQGIIDLVNHYIGIALSTGFVGLSLFLGFFSLIIYGVNRARLTKNAADSDVLLARSLLAVIACILVIIATVSPITHVPFFYWTFAALSVAFIRMMHLKQHQNLRRHDAK